MPVFCAAVKVVYPRCGFDVFCTDLLLLRLVLESGVWVELALDEDVRLRLRRLPMILKTRPDHMNTRCV